MTAVGLCVAVLHGKMRTRAFQATGWRIMAREGALQPPAAKQGVAEQGQVKRESQHLRLSGSNVQGQPTGDKCPFAAAQRDEVAPE